MCVHSCVCIFVCVHVHVCDALCGCIDSYESTPTIVHFHAEATEQPWVAFLQFYQHYLFIY